MVQAIRETQKLLGTVDYSLNEKKQKQRRFSRSLYISKDIKKGEVFSLENIKSVRPGFGLHPKYLNEILGKKALKDYKLGDRVEKYTF
jgi:pseudaminic acid synthase